MAATLRSVSYIASENTSYAVAKPSGTAEGDVLIAWQAAGLGSSLAAPTGGGTWLPLEATSGGDVLPVRMWWRVAGASEPTGYGFSHAGGAESVAAVAAISGGVTTPPLSDSFQGSGVNTIDTPSVTPSTTGAVELRFAAAFTFEGASLTPPSGLSPRFTASADLVVTAAVSRKLNSAAASGVKTFTGSVEYFEALSGMTVAVLAADSGQGGGEQPEVPPPTVPALPASAQVVHYTFEFCDLLTDDLICKDLDLRDVSYDRKINEAGHFSASLDVTNATIAAKVARIVPRHPEDLSTGPGRVIVHVYRNGVIWGSYVLWRAAVSQSGNGPVQVTIEGDSLESYLGQVDIREDLGPYEGEDQIQIARNLLTAMQATPRYDIGLSLQAGTSGITRDRSYLASEGGTFGERLKELAEVDGGFEYAIQVVDNGDGTRSRVWTWGYPLLGNAATNHRFESPGKLMSWSEDIDALRGGTAYVARGQSNNDDGSVASEAEVSTVAVAQAHIDAGWPGIDRTIDYSSVSDEGTLEGYATWWATNRAGTVRVHQATVVLPANTSFGPGNLGDRVTVAIVNHWWPIVDGVASFSKSWRVVGMSFQPPAKGSGVEICTLTFEENDA